MRFISVTAAALTGALTLAACGGNDSQTGTTASSTPGTESTVTDTSDVTESTTGDDADGGGDSIVDVVASNADFSILGEAIEIAEIGPVLAETGPYTVFAPTNAAVEVTAEELGVKPEDLLSRKQALVAILTYHVADGEIDSAQIEEMGGEELPTKNGQSLRVAVSDNGVTVNDANVTAVDLKASNGIVHVIDKMLVPPEFNLDAFPVDAPQSEDEDTDDSMADDDTTDDSMADDDAAEGDENEGDGTDGEDAGTDGEDAGTGGEDTGGDTGTGIPPLASGNLMMVAADDPDLTTFVQATGVTDLYKPLAVEGVFTIFAPTNEAFEAALKDLDMTAEELLADKATLTKVMNNHIVAGDLRSNVVALLDGESIETIGGGKLDVTVDGDSIMIGDATVTEADMAATNGVIHVIDQVLLP